MNILERSQNMKKVSSNKGGEYHGPCPLCGGMNRFHIWPTQDDGKGSWWCRGCEKGGDALQWLRDVEGMSYRQACESVGKEYDPQQDTSEPAAQVSKKQFQASEAKQTSATWQERAERFTIWAHDALLELPDTLQWLNESRGISTETIKELRIGYNSGENGKDIYRARSAWALEDTFRDDGKVKKLWLPIGVTIPWGVAGIPSRIRIRRPEGDPRYYVVPGSSGTPMLLDATPRRAWKTIIVVESELDGIMLYSQAGHLAAYLALGSCSTRPDANVIGQILEQQRGKGQAIQIKVALDSDGPGAKESKWWADTFGATIYPVPAGHKDPGEAFQSGVDLVKWVEGALPPAFKIQQAAVTESSNQNQSGPPPLIQSMTDRKGRAYTITDSRKVYYEKQDAGEVVFSTKEMELSIKAVKISGDQGSHLADLIMEVKNIFKGSFLSEVEDLRPTDVAVEAK